MVSQRPPVPDAGAGATAPAAASAGGPRKGKVLFSKFDLSATSADAEPARRKLDPLQALKKAQRKEAKLAALTETDAARAGEVRARDRWNKAMDNARGVAVRDDQRLLKRAIKKRDQRKKRSKRKWAERTAQVAHSAAERQRKRSANIQARSAAKKTARSKKVWPSLARAPALPALICSPQGRKKSKGGKAHRPGF